MIEAFQIRWLKFRRCARLHWQKSIIKLKSALESSDSTNRYLCPCCGKSYIKFVDWSAKYQNTVCPNCDSQPRHRALAIYLDRNGELEKEKLKVLHFAPTGSLRKRLSSAPNIDYVTADLNDPSVDVKVDVTEIPYPDNTFDAIFCNHVLEHVPNDRQAMRELFRVLKPGGWASLQVPFSTKLEKTFEDPDITSPQERLVHFGQEDHVRLYGLDYPNRLAEAGFTVEQDNIKGMFESDLITKYRLNPKEVLFFGRKQS